MNVENGDRVREKVSGFEGVVVARCEYLSGYINVKVQSETLNPTTGLVVADWFQQEDVVVLPPDDES